ncbi:MAG: transposase [Chromatiales bacterium]|nr:transposase [Chromatiales bacterium]
MPRTGRIVVAGYPHHVVHRGHNRDPVFLTAGDRFSYLDTLREFRAALRLQVYGYCLMTNHVHLIINPGADCSAIGRLMKRLAGRHTRRINRLKSRTGTAWEGRFKCSLIDTNSYLLACSRYVDLNPVRANLVSRPEEYSWSSFRALAGLADSDWLDESPCYLALGESSEDRQKRYRDFVGCGVEESELEFLRDAVRRNQLTGSDDFVREMEDQVSRRISTRAPGRPRRGEVSQ